jgi:osmotically-inducible protein OsmY
MEGHVGKTKDIREAVEAELAFDPLVDAANITVKDTNGEARCSEVGATR